MSNIDAQSQKELTAELGVAHWNSGFLSLAFTSQPSASSCSCDKWQNDNDKCHKGWNQQPASRQKTEVWTNYFKCQKFIYILSGIKWSTMGSSMAFPVLEWASHSLQQRASHRHHTGYIRQREATIQQDTAALSQPGSYCPDTWTLDLLITVLQHEGYPELHNSGGYNSDCSAPIICHLN